MKINKVNFCVITTIMITFKNSQLIILKVTGPSLALKSYEFIELRKFYGKWLEA